MKKIMYKVVLISLFLIGVCNIKSQAASDFSYTLDNNGNATITAYKGSASSLTIPSTIDGHKVTTIGSHAFDENRTSTNGHTIKQLVISEGITRIDGWAFAKCENLESVKLPESLTTLDWQIFLECEKLTSINIPHNLTFLNQGFLSQSGIKEIIIPKNIQKFIGDEFRSCKNLKKAYIYNDDINYYNNGHDTEVFKGCDSIILYGNEGSTTQKYAQQNGIQFELLSSSEEPPITTMGSIHLNKNELSLKENESETLTVSFLEIPSSTKVIWSSSNENVAVVENGKVTAKGVGNTIITVSTEDGKYNDTCNVEVKNIVNDQTIVPITSISLNKDSLSLYVGEAEKLVATILPNNASDLNLVWTSSNSNVATVENGKIVAKTAGITTITVSNVDGTRSATCNVTVIEKEAAKQVLDNTIAKEKLPQTGYNLMLLAIGVIAITLIAIIMYKKYMNYKDIK